MVVSAYVLNKVGADLAMDQLTDASDLPTFQATWSLNAWAMHGGDKDDFFIYDENGVLTAYFKGYEAPVSDLSTDEGYQNVKEAILEAQ